MMRSRRQCYWMSCGLAIALAAGVCVARVDGQTNDATAPAQPASQPDKAATTSPSSATEPPNRPNQNDYERLPFMAQTRSEDETESGSAAGLLARTLGALLLIVGLIAAVGWGLRRYGGAHFGGPAADAPELSVLATISLGERRSLTAVRFGNRLLLLGSTAQTITLLAAQERRLSGAAPPMRSVADLLADDEPPTFARSLALADARLEPGKHAADAETKTV